MSVRSRTFHCPLATIDAALGLFWSRPKAFVYSAVIGIGMTVGFGKASLHLALVDGLALPSAERSRLKALWTVGNPSG